VIHSVQITPTPGKAFEAHETPVALRSERIMARAMEVLEDRSKALHWMNEPNVALGGKVPLTLLKTAAGEHEVEALLGRIEHGVYS
jgi:putative toxin-antitoxin system antitoxin component (TIGR02293 family)